MTIPVPFIPSPEHLEAKITFKEADLIIELANYVVKELSSIWDPDKTEIEIFYNNSRFSERVAKGVLDALNRGGWNAELKRSVPAEYETCRFIIRKSTAVNPRPASVPSIDVT